MATQKPSIIVYSGPMFAGKSTSLINAYNCSSIPSEKKAVFKYAKDIRYSTNSEIVTHDKLVIPCIMITSCADITEYLNNNSVESDSSQIEEIYIDECQFLQDIYIWVKNMQSASPNLRVKNIILAGLDLDASGKPFTEAFKSVIEIADINYALSAKCYICNENAPYTKLIKTENINKMIGNVLIGGAELYQPVCDSHFTM